MKRNTVRIPCENELFVSVNKLFITGTTKNLSRSGILIEIANRNLLKVGVKYRSTINGTPIYLKPKWIKNDSNISYIGCELCNMTHKWYKFLTKSYYGTIN